MSRFDSEGYLSVRKKLSFFEKLGRITRLFLFAIIKDKPSALLRVLITKEDELKSISNSFPITDEEYERLEKEFGQLAKYAAWQLLRKNTSNNHTDEFDDVNQELIMSLLRAGSYYKRQVYIEECFKAAKSHSADDFINFILKELENLWHNRTRHGANRQKFGPEEEKILNIIVKAKVPRKKQPDRNQPLRIDCKFATYCKAIAWNAQKSMGRKITKEKTIRNGITSLSEYDYLGSEV